MDPRRVVALVVVAVAVASLATCGLVRTGQDAAPRSAVRARTTPGMGARGDDVPVRSAEQKERRPLPATITTARVSAGEASNDDPPPRTHEEMVEAERELDAGLREAFAREGVDQAWARRSAVMVREAASRAGLTASVTCRSRHCEIRPEFADPAAADTAIRELLLDPSLSAEFSQLRNTGGDDDSDGRFAPVWFLVRSALPR